MSEWKRMRIVLHDETLIGMYAKALGYDVPTRAQAAVHNAVMDTLDKWDEEALERENGQD